MAPSSLTFAHMNPDERYMHRCLQLARLGAGQVAPNPMVGAVLVHDDRIIGEGYHQHYGQAHAEVNCLAAVQKADKSLIPESTMYVSLEPCAHFGKTPPCADRLVAEKVKRVVIACRDPFAQVDGKGIEKLQAAGIEVTFGVLEAEATALNKRFFTFHRQQRPYIILKWAQSADGFIGREGERTAISHAATNRLVHRWRSEEAAIMVGSQTAWIDNPRLDVRLWSGRSPVRILMDSQLRIPASYHLLDGAQPTIIFNEVVNKEERSNEYVLVKKDAAQWAHIMQHLHNKGIQSVLVEGGRTLLQAMIDAQLWDDCRVITNASLVLGSGVAAPVLHGVTEAASSMHIESDDIRIYSNPQYNKYGMSAQQD